MSSIFKLNLPISLWIQHIGFWAVCGMAVTMTFSRAFFNLFALIVVLAWVFSGRFRYLGSELKQSPALLLCVLLFAWITVSAVYSPAPAAQAWGQVGSYAKLLLIPIMASFIDSQQRIKMFAICLITGLMIFLAAYLAHFAIDIPFTHSAKTNSIGAFRNYIVEGLNLATLALIMTAASAALYKQHRWGGLASLSVATVAIYCVFFLNPGRGAQLALVAGLLMLVFLLLPHRVRWIGLLLSALIIGALAWQSPLVNNRFERALNEAKTYDTNIRTSVGLRLNAWRAGLDLWRTSPVIGHGAGSYQHLIQSEKSDAVGGCARRNPVCLQPHSQYVLQLVEQGAVGLLLVLALFASLVWPAIKSNLVAAKLSAAFATAFAVHSAFDSGLRMGGQVFIFMIMVVLLSTVTRIQWSKNNSAPL